MTKPFKYFRIQIGNKFGRSKAGNTDKTLYSNSLYMQSRDRTWISRNEKEIDERTEMNEDEDLPD